MRLMHDLTQLSLLICYQECIGKVSENAALNYGTNHSSLMELDYQILLFTCGGILVDLLLVIRSALLSQSFKHRSSHVGCHMA